MAYTPTVWETGDVITAEKLNKAETGIAAASADSAPLFVLTVDMAVDGQSATIDKTLAEIAEAYEAGGNVFLCSDGYVFVDFTYDGQDEYDGVVLGLQSYNSPNVAMTPYVFAVVDGVLTWTVPH